MKPIRTAIYTISISFLTSSMILAQDPPPGPPPSDSPQQTAPGNGGWRRAGDPPPDPGQPAPRATMDPSYGQGQAPPPNQPYPRYPNAPYPNQQARQDYNPGPIPPKVTIRAGTFVTVRLNQGLSSDRNQQGDAFAATLVKPVVVDGVVVAERGQTVAGRVVEAKKAGRVEGVSRLGVQLTDLTLADGQPLSIQSQLINRNGPTSVGRDATAIGTTTGLGAAIGAAANGGTGAAVGAGAGAIVGIVGVLLTRGHPTYLYPEQVLTFRIEAPVTVSTEVAPQAFRWVNPDDYERPYDMQARMGPPAARPPSYYGYGYGYPYPYAYGYPYWGGFGFYWGPRFYYGRGYYGRGAFYGHFGHR